MSKKNVVRGRNVETGSDSGDERTETVDLGIGISVDLEVDAIETVDADDGVELAFDEREMLESADDGTGGESTLATGSETDSECREALETADIDPDSVSEKEYSYRMLLDAGVDESIADALRRQFSLPWSFESDGDLERRSSEVRGLGAAEREWISASGDEDWQAFEYEHATDATVGREPPSERPCPRPTPVTAVTGVGPDDADELAEAGVCSAERLATISAFDVARVLDLNVVHVRTWRHNARELLE
ncbi:hypothetical protein [Natronorubrum sp. FCH18a]|uniref:hypothetical protein n=1 Tax=Natronorubrum sp. FCH18a TaxID=3447018 RepID=UPI003F513B9F